MRGILLGETGLATHLKLGTVVMVSSTVTSADVQVIAVVLVECRLLIPDIPASGGTVKAAAGDMTMIASGNGAAFARLAPALDAVVGKVCCIGNDTDLSPTVKVTHRLLAGVYIAVVIEAIVLATRAGIPLEAMYGVVTHAAGNFWMSENRMQYVLDGDYLPESVIDVFARGLGLVDDITWVLTFPLPFATTALNMFAFVSNVGFGREDDSAVAKIFNGITPSDHKQ